MVNILVYFIWLILFYLSVTQPHTLFFLSWEHTLNRILYHTFYLYVTIGNAAYSFKLDKISEQANGVSLIIARERPVQEHVGWG